MIDMSQAHLTHEPVYLIRISTASRLTTDIYVKLPGEASETTLAVNQWQNLVR